MTTTDRTSAPDEAFAPVLAAIEAREPAAEGWEQRVERAARAIWGAVDSSFPVSWEEATDKMRANYRRLAAAALSADAQREAACCSDCSAPLASPDEVDSGLCLLCLNGPVPGASR